MRAVPITIRKVIVRAKLVPYCWSSPPQPHFRIPISNFLCMCRQIINLIRSIYYPKWSGGCCGRFPGEIGDCWRIVVRKLGRMGDGLLAFGIHHKICVPSMLLSRPSQFLRLGSITRLLKYNWKGGEWSDSVAGADHEDIHGIDSLSPWMLHGDGWIMDRYWTWWDCVFLDGNGCIYCIPVRQSSSSRSIETIRGNITLRVLNIEMYSKFEPETNKNRKRKM